MPQPTALSKDDAFDAIMGASGMPPATDPDYDWWLFCKSWDAALAAVPQASTPPNRAACEVERSAEKCWRQPCADTGRCEAPQVGTIEQCSECAAYDPDATCPQCRYVPPAARTEKVDAAIRNQRRAYFANNEPNTWLAQTFNNLLVANGTFERSMAGNAEREERATAALRASSADSDKGESAND